MEAQPSSSGVVMICINMSRVVFTYYEPEGGGGNCFAH